MADFDAGSIIARMDIDLNPFQHGLDIAKADADKFKAEAGHQTARVDVDVETAGAEAKLAGLGAAADHARGTPGTAGHGGYGMLGLIGAAIGLAPALAPGIAAVGLLGSAALAGAAQAGIGLAAFVAVAKSDFADLQSAIKAGVTLKGPAGEAEAALKSFDAAWHKVQVDTASPVFGLMTKGLQDAAHLLPLIEPLVVAVAAGLGTTVDDLNRFLSSPLFAGFLKMIETNAIPDIQALSGALVNFLSGAINLIEGLNPVTTILVQNIGDLSQKFLTFSQEMKNGGLQTIFAYIRQYGPETTSLVSGLFSALANIARGLAPLVGPALVFLNDFVKAVQEIHLQPLAAAFGSLLSVLGPVLLMLGNLINVLLPPLSTLIGTLVGSFIEPLVQALGQGLAPALQSVSTFAGELATPLGLVLTSIANLVNPTGVAFLSTLLQGLLNAITPLLGPIGNLIVALESIVDDGIAQLTPLLPGLTTGLSGLATAAVPVINFLTFILSNKTVATTLFDVALGLVAIKKAMEGYAAITLLIEGLTAAINFDTIALKAMYAADAIAAVAEGAWSVATSVAAAANWALDAAIWADPLVEIVMLVVAAIALLAFGVYELTQHLSAVEHFFTTLGHDIVNVWNDIGNFIGSIDPMLLHGLEHAGSWLLDTGKSILVGLYHGIVSGYDDVAHFMKGIDPAILSLLSDAGSWLLNIGGEVISGFWHGMTSYWSNTVEPWLAGAAKKVASIFSSALGVFSPSRVMMEIGGYTAQGFHLGFKNAFEGAFLPYVEEAMTRLKTGTKIDLGHNTTITAAVNATSSQQTQGLKTLGDQVQTLAAQTAALAGNIADALAPAFTAQTTALTDATAEQTGALTDGYAKAQDSTATRVLTAARKR